MPKTEIHIGRFAVIADRQSAAFAVFEGETDPCATVRVRRRPRFRFLHLGRLRVTETATPFMKQQAQSLGCHAAQQPARLHCVRRVGAAELGDRVVEQLWRLEVAHVTGARDYDELRIGERVLELACDAERRARVLLPPNQQGRYKIL